MKTFLVCVLVLQGIILAWGVHVARNTDHDVVEFKKFVVQFNKTYSTKAEWNKRFAIFSSNLNIAADLDASDAHADYGVTQFMDLSPAEFRSKYLISNFTSPKREGKSYNVLPAAPTMTWDQLPPSFDWNTHGAVTGVYNQGGCGSCWAFSTTENVESMWAIAGKGLINLSMQQLVDCAGNGNKGCGGGNPPWTYPYIISCGGMDSYQSYPYTGENDNCAFNGNNVAARISNWGYITTTDNENAMGSWTYSHGPPSICVDASQWQYYQGGVVTSGCGTQLDHCVQITGWQTFDNIPAWNVRNSWGTGFGYGGYILLMRGANICGLGQEVTSSVI